MFQHTLLRVKNCAAPVLVTNAGLSALLTEQFAETGIRPQRILLEPSRRNTAPALAAAALTARPEDLMLILPCDHAIRNPGVLIQAVGSAKNHARQGWIIAFGIRPRYAETGFGYIRRGAAHDEKVYRIDRFVEKPAKVVARTLVKSGRCDWNSGIFLLSAATALAELEKFEPALLETVRAALPPADPAGIIRLGPGFAQAPARSIDVAVMERSEKTLVCPVALDWCDLGTFRAVFRAGFRAAFLSFCGKPGA